ncbi:MAG: cpaC [Phenylobacterium sp.]|nr:cpaC [Phenylobacterium sp.]
MTRVPVLSRLLAGAAAGALSLALAAPAPAEVFHSVPVRHRTIFVPRDKSLPFHLDGRASKIVIAQPDTAAIVATSGDSFYIQGKDLGETNLLVYGPGGRLAEVIDVRVGYDSRALEEDFAAVFPNEAIRVRPTGEGLLLTGNVSTTGVANRAKALAEKYAPNSVTSNLTVRASQQVILEVRVLEASRSILHDIGVTGSVQNNSFQFATNTGLLGADTAKGLLNLSGGAGHTSIDVQLAALESKGVVRTLARPNLVALSGEKASFLAGGEFPYPVPQGGSNGQNTITLEFRKYGVKVDFKPEVEDNGLIRLEVEPEVSKLDTTNSIQIQGFSVPGLITRNTKTVVELRSGEALAIGGLYQRDYQNDLKQLPGLGEIPVLSALFRSARWRRAETELVIIVTPRLAEPSDFAKAQATQTLPGEEPSTPDLLLRGEALDRPIAPDGKR